MGISTVNPASGRVERTFPEWTGEQTQETLDRVAAAWPDWAATGLDRRVGVLRAAARILRERREELARLAAREMGKPVAAGVAEADKCALVCDYYADNGPAILGDQEAPGAATRGLVTFAPLGAILAVMPWNYPFWQVFRIAAPNLAAGNAMVLKHASNIPQCALAIEEIWRAAGLPGDVFRTLLIGSGGIEQVVAHPAVAGVSLTGSEGAGSAVAALAGRHLKKTVMELGGSDPFVVLADADLDAAARTGVRSRCGNAGQACIAAKRFILAEDIAAQFVDKLARGMAALRVGDPLDPATEMGPLATVRLRSELQDQVDRCVAAGGRIVLGGAIPAGPGAFYPPTIIVDLPPDAPVAREELFGPVALVFRARDEEEAVRLANDTPYGLGGSVWTRDEARGLALARRIQTGTVYVNGLMRSDPAFPFGGVKLSGYGRELARWGALEFVNVKTICVD